MKKELQHFVRDYLKAIYDNNAAIFAGAGLSIPAGFVNWKGLLRDVAEELELEIDKEDDLIGLAQYYVNEKGGRGAINQKLINEFTKGVALTPNLKLLASLPIRYYWTTNYDKLIERALDQANKEVDVKISQANLSTSLPRHDAILYKMHGDINQPQEAVLTKDDYENYNAKRQLFTTALQGDLVSKTFLFIGFSFDDPNLSYILSRIRVLLGENQRDHYCFFKQPQTADFQKNGLSAAAAEEFCKYERLRLQYKVKDLKRYAIQALVIDDYAEITEVLDILNKKIKRRNIFISGAAYEYGHWEAEAANALVYELSRELVKNNYRLITGFGKGIGSSVINGVLAHVFSTKYQHLDESIIMRPFPQLMQPGVNKKQLQTDYRIGMVEHAGIAVFMFGNRLKDRQVVLSQGVMEEFELSFNNGKGALPIPIGATGYMAETIWQLVSKDLIKYGYVSNEMQEAFMALNDRTKSAKELINIVEKIVNLCQ